MFLDMTPKAQATFKKKYIKHQNRKLLCFKGHDQEGERTTHQMVENFCYSISSKRLVCELYYSIIQ